MRKFDSLPATVKGVINEYKEPLRPVKDGFGYQGTLVYDESLQYTQCHICGSFYRYLGQHVRFEHDLKAKEYKAQYELTGSNSLLAPKTQQMVREKSRYMKQTAAQRIEQIKKMVKAQRGHRRPRKSLQAKNKEGKCPDQLIQKIIELSEQTPRTPSMADCRRILGYGWLQTILRTFGTWNNAVKLAGLKPNDPKDGRSFNSIYSETQLVAMLRDFKEQQGREPYAGDAKNGVLPSTGTYARRFGGWKKAKQFALK